MDAFYHNPCFPHFQADHTDLISNSLNFSFSSCSATPFVHSFNLNQELQSMDDEDQDPEQVEDHDHELKEDDQVMFTGNNYSEDQNTQIKNLNSFKPLMIHEGGSGVDDVGKQCNTEPTLPLPPPPPPPLKWMSSKMRLMKKMSSTDHQTATTSTAIPIPRTELTPRTRQRSSGQDYDERSDDSPNIKIRVCSDCNTTKTPLWRSGPQGPKSLCNACGIRQRKARRAMAAAVANGGLLSSSNATGNKVIKEKRPAACSSTSDHKITHYKKKCKLGSQQSKKNINFDEFKMTLSKSSTNFQQVFPHDEIKEAAILLMALSCTGLVQG